MPIALSPLSLAASGIYVLVVAACVLATSSAIRERQQAWHIRTWLALAALFAGLVLMRLFDVEEVLRDALRDFLRYEHSYGERRNFQRPIASAIIALAALGAFVWFYRATRAIRGRRNIAAMAALAGGSAMVVLIILRLVSLSPVDSLLYGPLKLNWIGDIGLSVLVLGAGAFYSRIVRAAR